MSNITIYSFNDIRKKVCARINSNDLNSIIKSLEITLVFWCAVKEDTFFGEGFYRSYYPESKTLQFDEILENTLYFSKVEYKFIFKHKNELIFFENVEIIEETALHRIFKQTGSYKKALDFISL